MPSPCDLPRIPGEPEAVASGSLIAVHPAAAQFQCLCESEPSMATRTEEAFRSFVNQTLILNSKANGDAFDTQDADRHPQSWKQQTRAEPPRNHKDGVAFFTCLSRLYTKSLNTGSSLGGNARTQATRTGRHKDNKGLRFTPLVLSRNSQKAGCARNPSVSIAWPEAWHRKPIKRPVARRSILS